MGFFQCYWLFRRVFGDVRPDRIRRELWQGEKRRLRRQERYFDTLRIFNTHNNLSPRPGLPKYLEIRGSGIFNGTKNGTNSMRQRPFPKGWTVPPELPVETKGQNKIAVRKPQLWPPDFHLATGSGILPIQKQGYSVSWSK